MGRASRRGPAPLSRSHAAGSDSCPELGARRPGDPHDPADSNRGRPRPSRRHARAVRALARQSDDGSDGVVPHPDHTVVGRSDERGLPRPLASLGLRLGGLSETIGETLPAARFRRSTPERGDQIDARSAFAAACRRSLTSASSRAARSMRSCWISERSCWLTAPSRISSSWLPISCTVRVRSASWPATVAMSSLAVISAGFYAASGMVRARASADESRASITRSAWSATRSSPRTRSGAKPYSFSSRPNTRPGT